MKPLLIIAALFLLGHGTGPVNGPSAPPPAHPYVVPACNGAAHVPGYEKCHK